MYADDTVVHFAATAQPLPPGAGGMHAALGGTGFVNAADGLLMCLFAGDQSLAFVAYANLIPLDRFQETL
jgi:hypothetical protein